MIYVLAFFTFFSAIAKDLKLDDIDLAEFSDITKEIQANFTHTAVGSAGTHGKIFGLDTGIVAGLTKSERLGKLAKEYEPKAKFGVLPHAAFLASASVPFGFTGEATIFPAKKYQGVEYKSASFALKWTFSQMWKSFFDNAIRFHYSTNQFSYSQVINNSSTANIPVDASIKFSNYISGVNYLIGKKFGIVEPWIGAGYVQGKSTININASGSATILNQEVSGTGSQSAQGVNRGLHYFAGVQVSLTLMTAGIECARNFNIDKCTLKTSLSFGL